MFHDLPVWAYIGITLILTHLSIVSVTVFLHRHQAHRALALHPAASHAFRLWLWLTTGMVTREWVAVHRKHHARVETPDDPHSPQQWGILTVLFLGTRLYRAEARQAATLERYGHETPDDWLERRLYAPHSGLGLLLMLLLDLALFGVWGLGVWAAQMAWIPFFAAGVINGLGHWWGYRNFELADASTNIFPVGMLIGGEELHNNHHAFAGSARFSSKWYEFDLGWWYIRLMRCLRLARVRRLAPVPHRDHSKRSMDLDTVQAVISNRLHVMSQYVGTVVKQVYREEKSAAGQRLKKLLRQGKRGLMRHEFLLDADSSRKLERALAGSKRLRQVHDFKQRLQDLWLEKSATQESLLAALQEWCRQAETTGIQALQEFAARLRTYSIRPGPQAA